jgi:hypothetical protein
MIDWTKIKYFKKTEFPENPDKFAEPKLIERLDEFRDMLGRRVYPSPVKGSLARYKEGSTTSRHYADDTKKSRAIDFFPEGVPVDVLMVLLYCGLFNGIGIYLNGKGFDGKPWVRFHVDTRKKGIKNVPLIWIVDDIGTYHFPQTHPGFWKLFKDDRLYTERIKRTS